MRRTLEQELLPHLKGQPVNSVIIMMFSKFKDTVDKDEVKRLSEYLNGRMVNTYTNRLVKQCGDLSSVFKDIDKQVLQQQTEQLVNYYTQKAN